MTHRVLNKHKAWAIIPIQESHEDNPMHPSSSSPQWFCGNMPAMWKTNGGVYTLLVLETTECSTSTRMDALAYLHDFTVYVLCSMLCVFRVLSVS